MPAIQTKRRAAALATATAALAFGRRRIQGQLGDGSPSGRLLRRGRRRAARAGRLPAVDQSGHRPDVSHSLAHQDSRTPL
jgi:hypothetical protein